ncbi:QacE family quaternary ammonium compound efflux SMR transporter [Acuticoccus sediminis]|uniref:QacE family quaternary ammonium compound efflux SMR transporter n=1 Tax=Acuticoccus sediminis TaxID=2184697 RepID=A0A8B2NP45_9HYPH|nr:QacE family quaternary ammonium compound efflux SMR transporter [Acuticoccus sediminis]
MFKAYAFLTLAIVAEVIATLALSRSGSLTRAVPTVITVVGYTVCFACLSVPMRVLPTGVVYAIWSGLGIVLISLIAWLRFGQALDTGALAGVGLIVAGVVVINVFSNIAGH